MRLNLPGYKDLRKRLYHMETSARNGEQENKISLQMHCRDHQLKHHGKMTSSVMTKIVTLI